MECGIFCHTHHTCTRTARHARLVYDATVLTCDQRIDRRTDTCTPCCVPTPQENVPHSSGFCGTIKDAVVIIIEQNRLSLRFFHRKWPGRFSCPRNAFFSPKNAQLGNLPQQFSRIQLRTANFTCFREEVSFSVHGSAMNSHRKLGLHLFVTFWTLQHMTGSSSTLTLCQDVVQL